MKLFFSVTICLKLYFAKTYLASRRLPGQLSKFLTKNFLVFNSNILVPEEYDPTL
jgi:hypothetical protein